MFQENKSFIVVVVQNIAIFNVTFLAILQLEVSCILQLGRLLGQQYDAPYKYNSRPSYNAPLQSILMIPFIEFQGLQPKNDK